MEEITRTARAEQAEIAARQALDWLLIQARPSGDDGLAWPWAPSAGIEPSLYYGGSGVVLALLEGRRHFGDARYGEAARRGARHLAEAVDDEATGGAARDSLYFGLAGLAFTLRAVDRLLGDPQSDAAADRALALVRAHFDGERWNEMSELLMGNAGIGLGALAAGDPQLALLAVEPYLRTADETPGGVNWPVRPSPPRSHHMAHGTLGIVYALAAIGSAAGRADLVELARRGAADVVARETTGPDGFLVPHSDPPHRPDIIEPISYGWCNGPAGDAQVFRLFEQLTGEAEWTALIGRCLGTLRESGLPRRLRPGFWDNSGRCCGTASVLALVCDRLAEHPGAGTGTGTDPGLSVFADGLVADLLARATVDETGARWSNFEHRNTPSELEPHLGWAHGNAGIIPELLRYARLVTGADQGYAVPMPDHAEALAGVRA